ncbi:hypothetical protein J3R30DRAFT_164956 [Lentinula aciculospora]|uniref:Uncharacterized protein n=1 Tax=Lentinula aciculospora TaxID=153920 RepID=A0A9W9AUK8_9AGAR|nr:hypothetical protein J3R30DRAFT_164956 [Lentinula aciculospora]
MQPTNSSASPASQLQAPHRLSASQSPFGSVLDTSTVNSARLLSSGRTIPCPTAQVRRGARRAASRRPFSSIRGLPAVRRPSLESCIDRHDNERANIRLLVKVYPGFFMRDTFNDRLRQYGLLHELLILEDKLVTEIIRDVAWSMTTSHGFIFPQASVIYREHEVLPLNLLAIHDRGIGRNDPARLRRHPVDPTWSVSHLMSLTNLFAIPSLVVENNRMVIFLVVNHDPPLTADCKIPENCLNAKKRTNCQISHQILEIKMDNNNFKKLLESSLSNM